MALYETLSKYKKLLDDGVITEDEFNTLKRKAIESSQEETPTTFTEETAADIVEEGTTADNKLDDSLGLEDSFNEETVTNNDHSASFQQPPTENTEILNGSELSNAPKSKTKLVVGIIVAVIILLIIALVSCNPSGNTSSSQSGGTETSNTSESQSDDTETSGNWYDGWSAEDIQKLKDNAIVVDYESIMRNPDDYKDKFVKIEGEVLRVYGGDYAFKIDTKPNSWGGYTGDPFWIDYYSDTIMPDEGNLIEDDLVVVYGYASTTEMEGGDIWPKIDALIVELM